MPSPQRTPINSPAIVSHRFSREELMQELDSLSRIASVRKIGAQAFAEFGGVMREPLIFRHRPQRLRQAV